MKAKQIINDTIFEYEVLNYVGKFRNNKWFLVRNIETGFIQTIPESELIFPHQPKNSQVATENRKQ